MKNRTKNCFYLKALPVTLLVLVFGISGCEKVIDVDLNAADPVTVIEGNISDQPGPYTVSLTKSVNFDDPNIFPGVSGATVIVNDNAGNTDTLTESKPGIYQSQTLQGVPGRDYFLRIKEGVKQYTAVSGMPLPVKLDTILIEQAPFGRPDRKIVKTRFQDPADIENYYRLIITVRDTVHSTIYLTRDDFSDGEVLETTFYDNNFNLSSGDVVKVDLLSITRDVSEYLRYLNESGGGGQSASPANPPTNIANATLGYFSAHSVTSKSIVVP